MEDFEKFWGTNDMVLATFLTICGERVVRLYWFRDEDPRDATCFFMFKDTWSVRMCHRRYLSGDNQVNAAVFSRKFAALKNKMFTSNKPPRDRRPSAAAI